jgi:hypothetical protein
MIQYGVLVEINYDRSRLVNYARATHVIIERDMP